jgi:uncharacterized membrane protein
MINKFKETIMITWVKDRLKERTSWDGGIIVAGSLAIILFGGIVKIAAWAGLAYGIWTFLQKEED